MRPFLNKLFRLCFLVWIKVLFGRLWILWVGSYRLPSCPQLRIALPVPHHGALPIQSLADTGCTALWALAPYADYCNIYSLPEYKGHHHLSCSGTQKLVHRPFGWAGDSSAFTCLDPSCLASLLIGLPRCCLPVPSLCGLSDWHLTVASLC